MTRLLIAILFFPLLSFSQKDNYSKYLLDSSHRIFPEVDGAIIYSEVITVDSSIKKEELFNRAKAWFVDNYKSANDVIQLQDKDAGVIIGKGIFDAGYNLGMMVGYDIVHVSHTVKIYVKDGKFKYEIVDLSGKYYETPTRYSSGGQREMPIGNIVTPGNKKNYKKFLEDVNAQVRLTILSLKAGMQKPFIDKTNF